MKPRTRWEIRNEAYGAKAEEFADELRISPLTASLLISRDINEVEHARRFLNPLGQDFHDPFLMDGMETAIDRINKAISAGEKILIFGDYDADGVSSTVIMLDALRSSGAVADFYIPNRFTEGYGPNEPAFRQARDKGYSLIITVDTGISALNEAKAAKELGLDLIITDHHEPQPELPEALAIIHPKLPGGSYPFHQLAGAGVALKVAHALLGSLPEHLVEISAIGTIADLVPLKDENRLIAVKGLQLMNNTRNHGLKALLKVSGVDGKIDEETVGFAVGPRINAAGRLGQADPAVHLLSAKTAEQAEELAAEIDELNKERQQLVSTMTEEAIAEVEGLYPPDTNDVLVIARPNWNAGVIGIVASRLVDRYYRPAIVLSIDEETGLAKGSARSIDGFDMFQNLSKCRDILPHFGGHPMAAGMTLNANDIDKLRDRLNEQASALLSDKDMIPKTEIDVACSVEDISLDLIEQIKKLAPFGMGNPKPRVLIEESGVKELRRIGSSQNHLKLLIGPEEGKGLDVIGFGFGDKFDEISPSAQLSAVGELSINEWNGRRKPQLMLRDLGIESWQLFDWRGAGNVKKRLSALERDRAAIVAFKPETFSALGLEETGFTLYKGWDDNVINKESLADKHLVLLDLPPGYSNLEKLLAGGMPERIYAVFLQQDDHFFSTLPKREHFKWFYAFLLKQKTFDLNKYGAELSRRKGWSRETINFMSKVFFELEFVTIENGLITITDKPQKRDITSSETYKTKQARLEVEQDLYYSSYQQLRQWFEQVNKRLLQVEEAIK